MRTQPTTAPHTPGTHDCPGCGASGVPNHLFACRRDWWRLPAELRRPITRTYVTNDIVAHADAMRAAQDWYRSHPLPGGAS